MELGGGVDGALYLRIAGVVGVAQFNVGDAAPITLASKPRLVLSKSTAHLAPYEFLRVYEASPARDGMVWLVSQFVESGNRHFTEGCIRVYNDDNTPPAQSRTKQGSRAARGLSSPNSPAQRESETDIQGAREAPTPNFNNFSFLLSSGVEDYFDSAYHWTQMGWPVPLYHGANAGLTHWNLNPPTNWSSDGSACSGAALPGHGVGTCRLAAYKVHNRDHVMYVFDPTRACHAFTYQRTLRPRDSLRCLARFYLHPSFANQTC
jgi:hypothetical protein